MDTDHAEREGARRTGRVSEVLARVREPARADTPCRRRLAMHPTPSFRLDMRAYNEP